MPQLTQPQYSFLRLSQTRSLAGRLRQAGQEDRQHKNEVLDLMVEQTAEDSGGRRMSSVPTARIAIGNLQAETGLAFQMVYLEDSGHKQGEMLDSLRGQVAISQVLTDDEGYALAVIPRSWSIDLAALREEFGRQFRIVDEPVPGGSLLRGLSISDAGQCGVDVILEQSLACLPSVYLETGHPHMLIHLDGESFRQLFYGAWCGCISQASELVHSASARHLAAAERASSAAQR